MAVASFTQEYTSPIAPGRMFRALIVESSGLIPKLLPQFISSVELVHGDGGSGSIEQVNFTEATNLKYVRHRIDELDGENFVCRYTMIEGDLLGDMLESINHEIKFEATSDGGSICRMTSKYNPKEAGFQVDEAEIKDGREKATTIYKIVEAYLSENPQAYA